VFIKSLFFFKVSTDTSCPNNNTVSWLKPNLLLRIECWETHFYMKTKSLQTSWNAASFGVGKEKIEWC